MNLKIKTFCAICALPCLWASVPAPATTMDSGDTAIISESLGRAAQDRLFITSPLFEFSPFTPSDQSIVPGFADPLGIGMGMHVDPELRIFSGEVNFMDLLGNFSISKLADTAEIELTPGALQGIDLLDNMTSVYLSYDGRAFDKSLFNLQTAEIIERNGLPVTSETSPLSLSGFGIVSDNFNPFNRHWTDCPSQDKRKQSMTEAVELGRAPCSVPGACVCYSN